jgi:glycosyltransferase involved in cell wall biosynthesis
LKYNLPFFIETHTTNYDTPDLKEIYKIANKNEFVGLITIHDLIKKEHVKRGVPADKILVLDDGVDLKQFDIDDDKKIWRERLGLPINKKILLYSGGLYKEKGIGSIIKLSKRLRLLRDDFVTILVGGSAKDIDYWKQVCKNEGVSDLYFEGFKKKDLVNETGKAATYTRSFSLKPSKVSNKWNSLPGSIRCNRLADSPL